MILRVAKVNVMFDFTKLRCTSGHRIAYVQQFSIWRLGGRGAAMDRRKRVLRPVRAMRGWNDTAATTTTPNSLRERSERSSASRYPPLGPVACGYAICGDGRGWGCRGARGRGPIPLPGYRSRTDITGVRASLGPFSKTIWSCGGRRSVIPSTHGPYGP